MILVDTGPIVAVVNDRDDHHQECKHLLERLPGPLLVPVTVATEVCLMLERRRGTYAELAMSGPNTTSRPAQCSSSPSFTVSGPDLPAPLDTDTAVSAGGSNRAGDQVGECVLLGEDTS